MPGKGRRVAARQAELRGRRRRQGQGPSAGPVGTVAVEDRAGITPVPQSRQPVAAARASAAPAHPPASPQGSGGGRNRSRGDQPLAYNYVGAEMRRIFILTGVVLAILVALTIVLRKVI